MTDEVIPYSYHRIKAILKNEYALTLQKIYGYKAYRYGNPIRYNVVDADGNIVLAYVTLHGLRAGLTVEGHPLVDNGN